MQYIYFCAKIFVTPRVTLNSGSWIGALTNKEPTAEALPGLILLFVCSNKSSYRTLRFSGERIIYFCKTPVDAAPYWHRNRVTIPMKESGSHMLGILTLCTNGQVAQCIERTSSCKWITPGTSYGIKTKIESLGIPGVMVIRSATTEQEEKLADSAPVIPRKQQRSTVEFFFFWTSDNFV